MTDKFLHHNMELAGEQTMPGTPLLSADPATQQVLRLLSRCYPPSSDRTSVRVADLGCLEGGHSAEIAKAGYDVTGIEVRESNFQKCLTVQEGVGRVPGRLQYVQDDVLNLKSVEQQHGKFDAIFAGGILYHLEEPVSFLKLLFDSVQNVLILNTHFADPETFTVFEEKGLMGDLTKNEEYFGQWYTEYSTTEQFRSREKHELSSWNASRSFWLTKPELLRALSDVGFVDIAVMFNSEEDEAFSRATFVAWK
tara:strand:- start:10129 stop:10884 length:756 start_codon:yes stop_codon:yes gene_type:complete